VWAGPDGISDASFAAIVSSWREPTSGAIGGLAPTGHDLGTARGRAEVRPPFPDALVPTSPPVSIPRQTSAASRDQIPPELLPYVPEPALRELPVDPQPPAGQPPYGGVVYGAPYGVDAYGPDAYGADAYGPDPYGPYDDDLSGEDTQGWPPDLPPGYEPIRVPPQPYPPQPVSRTPLFDEQRQRRQAGPPDHDWASDALMAQTPVQGAPAVQSAGPPPPAVVPVPPPAAAPVRPGPAANSPAPAPPAAATPARPTSAAPAPVLGPRPAPEDDPLDDAYDPGAGHGALPQRVPSEPDVPAVPVDEARQGPIAPPADGGDLARIAARLRHDEDDEPRADERPDGFDIPAVIEAVRSVAGVREAHLRTNPGGVHTLRLELYDDADAGWVSRAVARLLNERMGLAAEPNPTPSEPALHAPVAPEGPIVYGREARRRRPVSGLRHTAEPAAAGHGLAPAGAPHGDNAPLVAPRTGAVPLARVVIDQVEVSTTGVEAFVEVRLLADGRPAVGLARGPAVDGYVLRLSAVAAGAAIDDLLDDVDAAARARCFIEQAAVVPLGSCEVAVVVLLLVCDGWVEQLTGSAVVAGDARQAVVRATLAAVNRRLEGLLP
jgi:hypothetical protein